MRMIAVIGAVLALAGIGQAATNDVTVNIQMVVPAAYVTDFAKVVQAQPPLYTNVQQVVTQKVIVAGVTNTVYRTNTVQQVVAETLLQKTRRVSAAMLQHDWNARYQRWLKTQPGSNPVTAH